MNKARKPFHIHIHISEEENAYLDYLCKILYCKKPEAVRKLIDSSLAAWHYENDKANQ